MGTSLPHTAPFQLPPESQHSSQNAHLGDREHVQALHPLTGKSSRPSLGYPPGVGSGSGARPGQAPAAVSSRSDPAPVQLEQQPPRGSEAHAGTRPRSGPACRQAQAHSWLGSEDPAHSCALSAPYDQVSSDTPPHLGLLQGLPLTLQGRAWSSGHASSSSRKPSWASLRYMAKSHWARAAKDPSSLSGGRTGGGSSHVCAGSVGCIPGLMQSIIGRAATRGSDYTCVPQTFWVGAFA